MCGELISVLYFLENRALELLPVNSPAVRLSHWLTEAGVFIEFNYNIYGVLFNTACGITTRFMFMKETIHNKWPEPNRSCFNKTWICK